ncbi:hypothetical protein MRX96_008749 [Rhipicephalus microplus]
MSCVLATWIFLLLPVLSWCDSGAHRAPNVHVPSIMLTLLTDDTFRNCNSEGPMISIPANKPNDNDAVQTPSAAEEVRNFVFPLRLEELRALLLSRQAKLALDFSEECTRKTKGIKMRAPVMASGWKRSRNLVFRLRSGSFLANLKKPLHNGTIFQVTIWVSARLPTPPEPWILDGHPDPNLLYPRAVNPNSCQVVSLEIPLAAEVPNHWVLAPRTYKANKCFGKCVFPNMLSLNSTAHSKMIFLSRLHGSTINYNVCCVPVSYESQSLIYVDDYGHVVLKNFSNMRVTACGCR